MKLSLDLACESSEEWIEAVIKDFPSFMRDHADCERKASSMALSFVAKYPDRIEILPELIETAIEELEHFQQVYKLMETNGISLNHEIPEDPYVKNLISHCRTGREERFLDRLLIASVVECRGAERFKLVSEALTDEDLKKFYKNLWISEAKHGNIFVKMALNYFDKTDVYNRLGFFIIKEAEVLKGLKIRAALH